MLQEKKTPLQNKRSPAVGQRRLNILVQDQTETEPWQHNENFDDWQQSSREMKNLSAGILWLMIARGVIARCFGARRRR